MSDGGFFLPNCRVLPAHELRHCTVPRGKLFQCLLW